MWLHRSLRTAQMAPILSERYDGDVRDFETRMEIHKFFHWMKVRLPESAPVDIFPTGDSPFRYGCRSSKSGSFSLHLGLLQISNALYNQGANSSDALPLFAESTQVYGFGPEYDPLKSCAQGQHPNMDNLNNLRVSK